PDCRVELWETATGQLLKAYQGSSSTIRQVAFGGPDHIHAYGENGLLWRWQRETGKSFAQRGAAPPLVFLADGQAAFLTHQGLERHDLETKTVAVSPAAFAPSHSLAFSANGKLVLLGQDADILLFEPEVKKVTGRLVGHQGPVLSVAVSQDGRWAVSG